VFQQNMRRKKKHFHYFINITKSTRKD